MHTLSGNRARIGESSVYLLVRGGGIEGRSLAAAPTRAMEGHSRAARRLAFAAAALGPLPRAAAPLAAAAASEGIHRFDLTGKVALITAGAGDLFGSSVTEGLGEAGAMVLTASRTLERNLEFCAALRERVGDPSPSPPLSHLTQGVMGAGVQGAGVRRRHLRRLVDPRLAQGRDGRPRPPRHPRQQRRSRPDR